MIPGNSEGGGVENREERKASEGCLNERVTAVAIGAQLTGPLETMYRTHLRLPSQGARKPGHLSSGTEGHS